MRINGLNNTYNTFNINNNFNANFSKPLNSFPSFQRNMTQEASKVVKKNKKGVLATILALFGLSSTKTVLEKTAPKEISSITLKTPIEVETKSLEYTQEELNGILYWERTNNNGEQFLELRNIIKHKENQEQKTFLHKEEVLSLANFIKEKPEILAKYLRSHKSCLARELVKLQKLYQKASEYYLKVAKYCPYANVDEYEIIAKNFSDIWPRERHAVSNYSRQRELIELMSHLQKTNPNDFMLDIYFSEYRFTFPPKERTKLDGISIKTTMASDLPTMTLEDLIKRLEYLKTPEGKTEHLR